MHRTWITQNKKQRRNQKTQVSNSSNRQVKLAFRYIHIAINKCTLHTYSLLQDTQSTTLPTSTRHENHTETDRNLHHMHHREHISTHMKYPDAASRASVLLHSLLLHQSHLLHRQKCITQEQNKTQQHKKTPESIHNTQAANTHIDKSSSRMAMHNNKRTLHTYCLWQHSHATSINHHEQTNRSITKSMSHNPTSLTWDLQTLQVVQLTDCFRSLVTNPITCIATTITYEMKQERQNHTSIKHLKETAETRLLLALYLHS